jgi:hypothetical protein
MAQETLSWHERVGKILNDWFPEPSVIKGCRRYLEADGFILIHESEIPHEHDNAENCPNHNKHHQVSIYNNRYFNPGKSKGAVLNMLLSSDDMRLDVYTRGAERSHCIASLRVHAFCEEILLDFVAKFPVKDPLHFAESDLAPWLSAKADEIDAKGIENCFKLD